MLLSLNKPPTPHNQLNAMKESLHKRCPAGKLLVNIQSMVWRDSLKALAELKLSVQPRKPTKPGGIFPINAGGCLVHTLSRKKPLTQGLCASM